MKSIMLSVKPQTVARILKGEQTILIAKSTPKEKPFKVVVYCTKAQTGSYKGNLYINPPEKRKEIGVADWWSERKDELSINGGYLQFNAFLAHGKVVAEFVCENVNLYVPMQENYFIGNSDFFATCLTDEEINNYGKGKDIYGYHITDLKVYDKPRELGEFRYLKKERYGSESVGYIVDKYIAQVTRPPQSWQYVKTIKEK